MSADLPLIVLAGGRAERMGFPKGLLEVDGETLLEQQLARFRAAGGRRVVVVLGAHADAYRARIPELFSIGVLNPAPETGPFGSLRVGLAALGVRAGSGERAGERRLRGVYVQPVDVPPPRPETYAALAAALRSGVSVSRPRAECRHGHPVLLSPAFAAKLLGIDAGTPEGRLDYQIRALAAEQRVSVDVDDRAILGNWNDPDDVPG